MTSARNWSVSLLPSLAFVAIVGCRSQDRSPSSPPKTVAVQFVVARNAKVEDFDGDPDNVAMTITKNVVEKLNDDEETFHAVAVPRGAAPPASDMVVSGEVTNVDGGSTAARLLVGWGAGDAVVGAQGKVTRADGTQIGIFSEEKIAAGKWGGQAGAVESAAERTASEIVDMIRNGKYRGGRPGNDGYLAPPGSGDAAHAPVADVEDRLRKLDDLRAKGMVTDSEYQEKRREILQAF